ncbi:MAG: AI-2E family transporter, partial [Desulfuromonadales bacterium]
MKLKHNITAEVDNTENEDGLKSAPSAAQVLNIPVDVRSFSLALLAVLASMFVLRWASAIFIPLMLGVMISYALTPFVDWMHKWRIPRTIGAAILLLGLLGGAGTLVYSLSDEASKMIETLPDAAHKFYLAQLKDRGSSEGTMEAMQKTATKLEQVAEEAGSPSPDTPRGVTRVQIEKPKLNIKNYLWMGTKGAVAFAGQLIMVLFLAYFMLASGDTFRRKLVKNAGPTLSRKKITLQVLDQITEKIQRYLLVQLLTSILVGVATWLVFLWIGLENAAVWGIAAGVLKTIPYLGPVVVCVGTGLVAFLQFETINMMLLVSGLSLLITSLEGYLLTSWLTGRASRMSPVVVFFSV